MPRKTFEVSSSSVGPLQKLEAQVTNSSFMLSATNYHLWAMRMEVYLEAHGLWDVITGEEENQKKNWLALSAILSRFLSP